MSAYIESDIHIDVIVSYFTGESYDDGAYVQIDGKYEYLIRTNRENRERVKRAADILWRQNVRSVYVRYDGRVDSAEPYRFTYQPEARRAYTRAEIAAAMDGLEYQSCETNDYHDTQAYKLLTAFRKHLLATEYREEQANTWSIDHEKHARKVSEAIWR